jgi:hypothetical protein
VTFRSRSSPDRNPTRTGTLAGVRL